MEFGGFIGGFGKNIFYERRDKERERGVLGMEGDFWVMYGKERYTKYVVIKVNYKYVN